MKTIAENPLSVAIITLNEENMLPDGLRSVAFADEVVVVDSGSTDNTVALAQQHGARVITEPWRGFGPQKQFAIDQCRNSWVLVLDADERIPAETATEIISLLSNTMQFDAYSFPRVNFFAGRLIRHGSWGNDRVVRLFNKTTCKMSSRMVHESVEVKGPVGNAKKIIYHYTRQSLQQMLDKINQYSSIGAQELFRSGKKATVIKALLNGMWAFVHNYFIRLGFIDGSAGLIIAASEGMYTFFKYAKLVELHEQKKRMN
jgi:glycosyltransferase involved in cell wall biosynthesis